MAFLRDLAPASFRGARFLVPRDHAEEGVNVVAHRYPGKGPSGHYMEPNGVFEPNFHVRAVLHGPTWLADFNRLRTALNTPSPGTLNHPWYGRQTVIAKHPWKVTRDDKDLGVLELDIHFLLAGSASFPSIITGIAASISGLAGAAVASSFANLTAGLSVPVGPFSQSYVAGLVRNVSSIVEGQFPATADVAQAAAAVRSASLPTGGR